MAKGPRTTPPKTKQSASRPSSGAKQRASTSKGQRVAAAPAPGPDLARLMPIAGLFVAVWASLPKYSGPKLNVAGSKEVVDHVVPAIVVLIASIVGILAGRRAKGPGATRFMAGAAVLLAGLWMMATHIPLVTQTMRGGASAAGWPATIYHTSSALAVFGLGLLWATVTWPEAGEDAQPAAKAQK